MADGKTTPSANHDPHVSRASLSPPHPPNPSPMTPEKRIAETGQPTATSAASNSGEQPRSLEEDEEDPSQTFEPCLFFFYGSLMDPDVLQTVTQTSEEPILQDAWIEGFEMKMWQGLYPTLLPVTTTTINDDSNDAVSTTPRSEDSSTESRSFSARIYGKAWYASSMEHCLLLQLYETNAYKIHDCEINLQQNKQQEQEKKKKMMKKQFESSLSPTNQTPLKGLTFIWAGKRDHDQLKEGTFDLHHWLTITKPAVWKK